MSDSPAGGLPGDDGLAGMTAAEHIAHMYAHLDHLEPADDDAGEVASDTGPHLTEGESAASTPSTGRSAPQGSAQARSMTALRGNPGSARSWRAATGKRGGF